MRRPIFENVTFLNETKKEKKLGFANGLKTAGFVASLPILLVKEAIKQKFKNRKTSTKEFKTDISKGKHIVDKLCQKAKSFVSSNGIKDIEITSDSISKTDYTKCVVINQIDKDAYEKLESNFEKFGDEAIKILVDEGFKNADFYGNHTQINSNNSDKYPDVEIGISIEPAPENGCYIAISIYATA